MLFLLKSGVLGRDSNILCAASLFLAAPPGSHHALTTCFTPVNVWPRYDKQLMGCGAHCSDCSRVPMPTRQWRLSRCRMSQRVVGGSSVMKPGAGRSAAAPDGPQATVDALRPAI